MNEGRMLGKDHLGDDHYEQVIAEESVCISDNVVYDKPETLTSTPMHYCPGCGHGVAHRLIAEVIQELNIQDKTIGVAPVGCAVFAYNYFDIDMTEAAHGRASAVATGIKRVLPDRYVFSYQETAILRQSARERQYTHATAERTYS